MLTNTLPSQIAIYITHFDKANFIEIERLFKNELSEARAGFSIAYQHTAKWFYYKWRLVSSNSSFFVCARIDGVLVGFFSVSEQRLKTESGQTFIVKLITDILVASPFRRTGILSTMLEFLYQQRKDNYFCIPNKNSLPIFNKLGFSIKGSIKIGCTLTRLITPYKTIESSTLSIEEIDRFEQCPFPIYQKLLTNDGYYVTRIFENKYITICVILGKSINHINLPTVKNIPLIAIISRDVFPFSVSLPSKLLLGSDLYIVCREKSESFENYSLISWDAM